MRTAKIFDGWYVVTEHGDVYSLYNKNGRKLERRKKPLKLTEFETQRGHKRVGLKDRKMYFVHRLVASAFLEGFKEEHIINHKNGIKSDNRLENLEISNNFHNQQHAFHVLGKSRATAITRQEWEEILTLLVMGARLSLLSSEYNITSSSLSKRFLGRLDYPSSELYKYDVLMIAYAYSRCPFSPYKEKAKKVFDELIEKETK